MFRYNQQNKFSSFKHYHLRKLNLGMKLYSQESINQQFLNPQVQITRCRICYDQAKPLLKLCQCSGSIAFVHQSCIVQWIEKRIICDENMTSDVIPTPRCQICKVDYSAKIKIGREQISKELFWENIKKLSTWNTFYTLACLIIYLIVFIMLIHWTWSCYWKMVEKNESILDVCLTNDHFEDYNFYQLFKYVLIWGIFPLHYLYTSLLHLKRLKLHLIDGSKQIIADITLIPKEIIKEKIITINA